MLKILFLSITLLFSATALALDVPDFIIKVQTDNAGESANDKFTIPVHPSHNYSYHVDCNNDGTNETATPQTGSYTCDYAPLGGAGTHAIRIKDATGNDSGFPAIYFNNTGDKEKLLDVLYWGNGKWKTMSHAFDGASNLILTATDVPDFSQLTRMDVMFYNATSADPDTSGWDTSKVTNMRFMFGGATNANPNTSGWNTSKVTNMSAMFQLASNANPNTRRWDTSKVTNMSSMFSSATNANPDTSGWDTSKVTYMSAMFLLAPNATPDTSEWDTSKVTTMRLMFSQATNANPNTSRWDTSKVTNMSEMFANATNANPVTGSNPNGSGWNTSIVTNMSGMFWGATNASPDTSGWNTSMVLDMNHMFYFSPSANPDTSSWDTINVTDMSYMFSNATSANPDLSGWDISHRPKMDDMFVGVTLPTSRYDAMLAAFAAQTIDAPGDTVNFHGGNSRHCHGAADKATLENASNDWNITDAGLGGCFQADLPLDLVASSDTGLYNYDNITHDTTLTVAVSCDYALAGFSNVIRIYQANGGFPILIGPPHDCIDSGTGMVNINLPTTAEGTFDLYYTVTDFGTNIHTSPLLNVTVDTTAPATPICDPTISFVPYGFTVTTVCKEVENSGGVHAAVTIPNMQCDSGSLGFVGCEGVAEAGGIVVSNDTVTVTDLAGNENTDETTGLTLLGDCNGSDGVNIQDVACVINFVKNNIFVILPHAADCDESGTVDTDDVTCTISTLLGIMVAAP